jgi:hypothetical protein
MGLHFHVYLSEGLACYVFADLEDGESGKPVGQLFHLQQNGHHCTCGARAELVGNFDLLY